MRVILADDAVVVREGLARLLDEHGIDVLAQASTARELVGLVAADPPDVAVIDIRMPVGCTNSISLQSGRFHSTTEVTVVRGG